MGESEPEQVNDQQFDALMQMHNDTNDLIRSVRDDIKDHVKEDKLIHDVVKRHSWYWRTVSGTLTVVGGWLGLAK